MCTAKIAAVWQRRRAAAASGDRQAHRELRACKDAKQEVFQRTEVRICKQVVSSTEEGQDGGCPPLAAEPRGSGSAAVPPPFASAAAEAFIATLAPRHRACCEGANMSDDEEQALLQVMARWELPGGEHSGAALANRPDAAPA